MMPPSDHEGTGEEGEKEEEKVKQRKRGGDSAAGPEDCDELPAATGCTLVRRTVIHYH